MGLNRFIFMLGLTITFGSTVPVLRLSLTIVVLSGANEPLGVATHSGTSRLLVSHSLWLMCEGKAAVSNK